MLSKACEKSRAILEEGHPHITSVIFGIYRRLKHAGFGDVATKVLEHLGSMAGVTPHSTGPYHQLIKNMLLLDQNIDEVYFSARRYTEEILEQYLGPDDRKWIAPRLIYSQRLGFRVSWRTIEIFLRSSIMQFGQIYGKSGQRYRGTLTSPRNSNEVDRLFLFPFPYPDMTEKSTISITDRKKINAIYIHPIPQHCRHVTFTTYLPNLNSTQHFASNKPTSHDNHQKSLGVTHPSVSCFHEA